MLESLRKVSLLCVACIVLLAAASCGGGGGGSASVIPSNKGAVTLSIKWPARSNSRLIPANASFIQVTLTETINGVAQAPLPADTFSRPPNNNNQVTEDYTAFTSLAPTTSTDTWAVTVDSYYYDPRVTSPGSSNPPLSGYNGSINVTAGVPTPLNVTLATTLAQYQVTWGSSAPVIAKISPLSTITLPTPASSNQTNGTFTATLNVVPQDSTGYTLLLTGPPASPATAPTNPASAVTLGPLSTSIPVTLTADTNTPPNYTLGVYAGYTGTSSLNVTYTEGTTTVSNVTFPVQFSSTSAGPSVNLVNAPPGLYSGSLTLLDSVATPNVSFTGTTQPLTLSGGSGTGPSIAAGVITDGNLLTPTVTGYVSQANFPIFSVTSNTSDYLYVFNGSPPSVDLSPDSTTSVFTSLASIAASGNPYASANSLTITAGSSGTLSSVVLQYGTGASAVYATVPAKDFVFGTTATPGTYISSISQDATSGVVTVNTKPVTLTSIQTATFPVSFRVRNELGVAEGSNLAGTISVTINPNAGSGGGSIH